MSYCQLMSDVNYSDSVKKFVCLNLILTEWNDLKTKFFLRNK